MKVFVAGATGVLGRRAVRVLATAGHEVTAVARSPERQSMVRALGASPVTVDLFDAAALRREVAGHAAVCNLATHIPPVARMASAGAWRENDRIRFEASRNLADAALAAGATCFVQESIAFLYHSNGDRWIDESSPLDPVANLRSAVAAESHAARVTEGGGRGVVLRFAAFYGHDSEQTLAMIRLARKRIAAGVGPDAYVSSIITDDAASAVAAALSAEAGIYNVGDDEPLTRRQFFAALSRRARCAPRGSRLPGWPRWVATAPPSSRVRSACPIADYGRPWAGRPRTRACATAGPRSSPRSPPRRRDAPERRCGARQNRRGALVRAPCVRVPDVRAPMSACPVRRAPHLLARSAPRVSDAVMGGVDEGPACEPFSPAPTHPTIL